MLRLFTAVSRAVMSLLKPVWFLNILTESIDCSPSRAHVTLLLLAFNSKYGCLGTNLTVLTAEKGEENKAVEEEDSLDG